MARNHPLWYWLQSINLSEYYTNFIQHGLIRQQDCACLNEQSLIDIGVVDICHRTQLLSHLPTFSSRMWIDDENVLPNLPPKTKSVRNSFLYQDWNPTDFDSQVRPLAVSSSKSATELISKPRPVPRPRARKASKSCILVEKSQSVPDVRPIPAPRSARSSQLILDIAETTFHNRSSCEKKSQSMHVTSTDIVNTAMNTKQDMSNKFNESSKINYTAQPLVILQDVCIDESLNDDPCLDLYSLPNKMATDSHSSTEQFYKIDTMHTQPIVCSGRALAANPNVLNQSNDLCDVTKSLAADDLYMNIDDLKDAKPMVAMKAENRFAHAPEIVKDQHNGKKCTLKADSVTKKREYVNIDKAVHMDIHEALDVSPLSIKDDENERLYEPIWAVDENIPNPHDRRSSPVVHHTPIVTDYDADFNIYRDRKYLNTQEKHASSIDMINFIPFNLPHPDFAPPPLPATVAANDILDTFDPLVQKQMHVIPPKPIDHQPPRFQHYVNTGFKMSPKSVLLPLHEHLEPDIGLISPQSIWRHDADIIPATAHDPFRNIDPFEEFSPDMYAFEKESLQTLIVSQHASAELQIEDFYAYAEEIIDDNFDPFGLSRQEVPLAKSSGNSGSGVGLNAVIPAPTLKEVPLPPANLRDVDSCSDDSLDGIEENDDKPDSYEDSLTDSMTQVEILNNTSLQRRKERSGYLYKQGGVKRNKGWDKRWVIFDGKTLRYYKNAKDQVSKRIIPVSCMTNVEMNVKKTDMPTERLEFLLAPVSSKQFKFKLHCTNRVFLFATDNIDDCKIWSSTLMEAILNHSHAEDVPRGDMTDPDLVGWIKINKNRYKYFVALKKHKMCYYQNQDDFELACPLHEIDMKLSAVKEIDRTKLQLATHYCTFMLNFESSSDASSWKMAIEEAIIDALGDNTILNQVIGNPANTRCADCDTKDGHWASLNLGIVLCLRCAGVHRGLDSRLSKVRSLRMDNRVWNSSLIEMFKEIGNNNANKFWLKNSALCDKINEQTPNEERKKHILEKYRDKKFCDIHPQTDDKQQLNEALLQAAQTDDVMLTYQILFSGANVLYHPEGKPDETVFELAKLAHQRIQMEFSSSRMEVTSLVAKLRAEVQLQGYLLKTGPNKKDFLKRWCVLEHGHLSYYTSEESKVEKDRIDNECMLCIQEVNHYDKHPFCFEISSKKNNRTYLFSASNEEEQLKWIQAISQVFCPIDFMELITTKNFCLAGYTYMKTGFQNKEWQRTWFMLENRTLIFIDKTNLQTMEEADRKHDSVDLRKVLSITKIARGMEACEKSLELSPIFVLKAGERLLYFQCDLVRDTERMYTSVESAVKRSGDTLEDQVLTNDDIPLIIEKCVTYIQHFGLTMQGIYRLAETDSKIQALLGRFREDARSVVLKEEEHTVHLVCNVLKRFFRNLWDPLFTSQLYKNWIQAASKSDHHNKLQWYKYLLQQLPRINLRSLRFLANHLYKLSQHSKENLMTLENISIAFGPTLMKCNKLENLTKGTKAFGNSMQLDMTVISDIVKYHEWLFDFEEGPSREDTVAKRLTDAENIFMKIKTKPQSNDQLMLYVFFQDPMGCSESVKINKNTTVSEVIKTLKHKQATDNWCLYEIVKSELVRPLHSTMKVLPIVLEWQNWLDDYRKDACLCFKESDLRDKIEKAYDPHKPLFAEMKCAERGKFKKMAFEFTQAKLSFYKDCKNVSNPAGSWNIEDLGIYKGCDPRRSTSAKFAFTFLVKGEKVEDSDHPYFGRAVCCATEAEQLSWLAALLTAQKSFSDMCNDQLCTL